MQKISTYKGFLLFTLLFVLIAVASFAAFRETEQVCAETKDCLRMAPSTQHGEMLWEVLSRQLLSLFTL